MRRVDLQQLSLRKVESAFALVEQKHWSNAYYLAGYSIEMALKAVISKQISSDTIPDKTLINKVYTHDINQLLGLAGLKSDHEKMVSEDSTFAANWSICSEWSPESRYQERSSAEAHYLLTAMTEAEHGVLPWIKKYW